MRHMLIISGRLDNLNDYIAACRANPHQGASLKARNENKVLAEIYSQLGFGRKVIQDALVQAHTLKNDGWNEITGFSDEFFVDAHNPRIEVEIEEVT